MTGLEVFLIIAGFACICISFFVSGKKAAGLEDDGEAVRSSAVWSEKEEQMIRDRIDNILTDIQNELVDTTEDQMNRLCNDKIMAVDEFSRQLLEKIENNHQEVVFMYNMLNEKEKEIKNIVLEPVKAPQPSPAATEEVKDAKPPVQSAPAVAALKPKSVGEPKQKAKPTAPKTEKRSSIPGNVNLQIQKMYKEGKSILEISKELNIGQGEVKLVIALYGGKR